jgi:hypothetical protein
MEFLLAFVVIFLIGFMWLLFSIIGYLRDINLKLNSINNNLSEINGWTRSIAKDEEPVELSEESAKLLNNWLIVPLFKFYIENMMKKD